MRSLHTALILGLLTTSAAHAVAEPARRPVLAHSSLATRQVANAGAIKLTGDGLPDVGFTRGHMVRSGERGTSRLLGGATYLPSARDVLGLIDRSVGFTLGQLNRVGTTRRERELEFFSTRRSQRPQVELEGLEHLSVRPVATK